MASKKKIGDEAEQFVAEVLREHNYLTEVHPRTFRIIYLHGKPIQVSQDNDYHNLFDVKAEKWDHMIYAQVKFEIDKANVSTAQKKIDKDYTYEFSYQRIQTWQVWKEWVKEPHRHKEYRFRIQERQGFTDTFWKGTYIVKGNWVDVELDPVPALLHHYIGLLRERA